MSCFAVLGAFGLGPHTAHGQTPGSDSTAAGRMGGGSVALHFDARPLVRAVAVGEYSAVEQSMAVTVAVTRGRASLRASATPVHFSGDTSATAQARHTRRGRAGATVALMLGVRAADSITLVVRAPSSPAVLSPSDVAAFGAVSTALSAFDAAAIGVPPGLTAGYSLQHAIGQNGVALHIGVLGDIEPRPANTSLTYWQGTTVRGNIGASRRGARGTLRADLIGSLSFSDSLDGSNMFTGGGTVTGEIAADVFLRPDSAASVTILARYGQPFSQARQEVPSRAIPVGAFYGVDLGATVTAGPVVLAPGLGWIGERSSAIRRVNTRVSRVRGRSSGLTAHLAMVIPVGAHLALTPDLGGSVGTVSQTVTGPVAPRFGRAVQRAGSFSDAVRGLYGSVGVSLSR